MAAGQVPNSADPRVRMEPELSAIRQDVRCRFSSFVFLGVTEEGWESNEKEVESTAEALMPWVTLKHQWQ